ncbi:MAG TPA: chemotaxis protein CheW [Bacteroidales bacterium]
MENNQNVRTNSYLTFKIEEEIYAANVSKVLSILELSKITKIPRTPDYIRGVINLRGIVLPIVDLRIKFGLTPTEFTTNTCILVLEITIENTSVKIGALVDSVQEVLEIEDNDILPPPNIGSKFRSDFIEGMFKTENSFIMILNMDMVFTHDELTVMNYSEAILAENKDDLTEEVKE